MKNILIISLVLAGSSMPNREVIAMTTSFHPYFQREKAKIKKEELPEPVRNKLNGDAFKGWVVINAYKLAGTEYEVELKKGNTTQVLKFDKDGTVR